MHDFAFPLADIPSLAIEGEVIRFPIRRVFCIGRNYWWAPDGIGRDQKEAPFFFMKPADAVVGVNGTIPYPPITDNFCHEIELVVAIGKDGADIARDNALSHVWGYTAGLDLTRRDMQLAAKEIGRPWEGAKAFDASAPTSSLLPVSRIGHPATGAIWLKVNGIERQRADLSDQIWAVPDVIRFLSRSVTLRRGDLIYTGTPAGVAALNSGDVITAGIEGITEFSVTIGDRKRS
jgi:fumarylpyruvate hydrolase